MTFSQYAGVAIVPTLARIVLAAAFISAGWNKVFKQDEFTAEQATKLRALGVNVEPVSAGSASTGGNPNVALIAYRRQATDDAQPGGLRPAAGQATESASQPGDIAQDTVPASAPTQSSPADQHATTPLAPGMYRAQAMHGITLILAEKNFPNPLWLARLAAFTELVGGAMLLLGLFSRIWGFGLAIAMGVAFYLVSMEHNGIFRMDPRVFAENIPNFNAAYCQAGLFVLAFGVFLTGAGPLSLDRILFGGPSEPGVDEVKID